MQARVINELLITRNYTWVYLKSRRKYLYNITKIRFWRIVLQDVPIFCDVYFAFRNFINLHSKYTDDMITKMTDGTPIDAVL